MIEQRQRSFWLLLVSDRPQVCVQKIVVVHKPAAERSCHIF